MSNAVTPPMFSPIFARVVRPLFALAALAFVAVSCHGATPAAASAATPAPKVALGIDVLEAQNFDILKGKRVGLLTNQAGVNSRGVSTIDVLRRAPNVKLVALYGPEHGINANIIAGVGVDSTKDPRTGLPVYSLYGDGKRRPTPAILKDIDVMVVDLQDIGTRSYTFVSCLRYTMEACFELGKTVVVLDRPNPLGGLKVGGPIIEPSLMSYVGAYPVPYVHGLTIGELAKMAKDNPGWLKGPDEKQPMSEAVRKSGQLIVVPMRGWRRSMLWPDTGLKWVGTSPNIPSVEAAFGYALVGLGGEIGNFSHGVGTPKPFRLLNFSADGVPEHSMPAAQLAAAMQAKNLAGLDFTVIKYKDDVGKERSGVYVGIRDWNAVEPTKVAFVMMQLAAVWSAKGNPFNDQAKKAEIFRKEVGSTAWWDQITDKGARIDVDAFFKKWHADAAAFQETSKKWWLYQP